MKKIILWAAVILLACMGLSVNAGTIPASSMTSLSGMLKNVMPTVVNVSAQGEISRPDNPFAEPNQQTAQPRRFESLGSGVIVDASKGYILTNAHVVRDVQTITVTLNDGRVFKAKLLGVDPASDVAVLQIQANKLTAVQLGDSDKLKVGDFVAAIGNPFNLNQTVTSGIVSALERSSLGIEGYENFIQTDASINPGNSGGALVDLQGKLIGINTAIYAPAGGNVGIGFAIPVNMARSVMLQLIKYGSVKRGLMGVIVQDLTPALANSLHIAGQQGALVAEVTPNSPASAAGIKPGDVIQGVDNVTIQNGAQVRNTVGLLRVGSSIALKVLRDGKTISLKLTTADPDQYLAQTEKSNRFLFGIGFMNFDQLTPAIGRVQGVQILRVAENSMGWRSGLRPGDVIVSANRKPVTNTTQLQQIAQQSKDELLLNILRGDGGAAFIVVK